MTPRLIPLPGGTDPNIPMEVSLRLGKPRVDATIVQQLNSANRLCAGTQDTMGHVSWG